MKEPLHTVGSLWYQWPLEAEDSTAVSKRIEHRVPRGSFAQPETHCFALLILLLISAFKSLWSLNTIPSFVL